MNTATNLTDDDLRCFAMFNAGRDWAASLKQGDIFRGSYGEADYRGLADWDAKFFSAGARAELSDICICIFDDSNAISSIERR